MRDSKAVNEFKRLPGMQDLFGREARLFEAVESSARRVFRRFGFEELRTPFLEEKKLFTHALGLTTDVVQKEMYEFTDKSGEPIALRPEGTAGVVRAYVENHFQKTQGLSKFFYAGAMFRRERPQKGRLRQFHQLGVETLGTDSPYADAETIHALVSFLKEAGVNDWRLKINNLGTFEERDDYRKALQNYFKPLKARLCADCKVRYEKNVFRILDCKVTACRELVSKAPVITVHLAPESRNFFSKIKETLDDLGIAYAEEPYLVRGLDYYTKTVFEVSHHQLGSQDALAAGGRYDRLVGSLGGDPTGAVGFALGVERLLLCLSDETASNTFSGSSFFVATLGEAASREGFRLLSALRSDGFHAIMDFSAKSLKSQLRSADKNQSRYVLILGDDELQKNMLIVKDMKAGAQEEIPLKDAVSVLKKKAVSPC